jgi:hypothetical protein
MIMPIVNISGMIIPIVHISGMIMPIVPISYIYIYVVWEKLYCSFIDFKKALDTVWRLGLWQKLVKNIDWVNFSLVAPNITCKKP